MGSFFSERAHPGRVTMLDSVSKGVNPFNGFQLGSDIAQ